MSRKTSRNTQKFKPVPRTRHPNSRLLLCIGAILALGMALLATSS